ncbi:MAG TPA: tetratricopeptide repeat protein [Thermoanaerobaculia bacterium]|nr:tetratricopeptide repeat protein [Thermoanaerobaculia bacterium]
MNRLKTAVLLFLALSTSGCLAWQGTVDRIRHGENPYIDPPYYIRYLDTGTRLDRQIQQALEALRQNPRSPALHNRLGTLLVAKGFPKHAEQEYLRAILLDRRFHPAWYNLALLRQTRGDQLGAIRALRRTIDLKPGHASAHFQYGLILEKKGRTESAIEHYAKAFSINHALLDVKQNPRILDTRLTARALIHLYPESHARRSLDLNPTPPGYQFVDRAAPSPVPEPATIVTPAPPVTDPGVISPAPVGMPEEEGDIEDEPEEILPPP